MLNKFVHLFHNISVFVIQKDIPLSKEIDVPIKYIGMIESGATPVLFQHIAIGCALDRCNGLQVQKNLGADKGKLRENPQSQSARGQTYHRFSRRMIF